MSGHLAYLNSFILPITCLKPYSTLGGDNFSDGPTKWMCLVEDRYTVTRSRVSYTTTRLL